MSIKIYGSCSLHFVSWYLVSVPSLVTFLSRRVTMQKFGTDGKTDWLTGRDWLDGTGWWDWLTRWDWSDGTGVRGLTNETGQTDWQTGREWLAWWGWLTDGTVRTDRRDRIGLSDKKGLTDETWTDWMHDATEWNWTRRDGIMTDGIVRTEWKDGTDS